jgi:hypothetical protein
LEQTRSTQEQFKFQLKSTLETLVVVCLMQKVSFWELLMLKDTSTSEGQSFTVVGMSYAIPSSVVCGVVDKLIAGNSKPKRVSLGVSFKHDVALGRGILNYEYGGEWRQIEQYGVVIESVQSGSVAYGKLRAGDRIESIEFYLEGSDEPMRVPMFNKYVFDDYAFRIKERSEIKIYLYDGNEISTTYKTITLGASITDFD